MVDSINKGVDTAEDYSSLAEGWLDTMNKEDRLIGKGKLNLFTGLFGSNNRLFDSFL